MESQGDQRTHTVIVTGPCGVGKTAVASAASRLLSEANTPHAFVDMDALRVCHPRPSQDPFHVALGLRNLAAVWTNCRAAGAGRLLIADVVEARDDLVGYRQAIPGSTVVVVGLRADLPTITARLARRESGESLAWHRRRAAELIEIMDRAEVEDLSIDTTDKSVEVVAREVLERSGWLGD